jgi:hypothetical protein
MSATVHTLEPPHLREGRERAARERRERRDREQAQRFIDLSAAIRRAERDDQEAQEAFDRARGVEEIKQTGGRLIETTFVLIGLVEQQKRLEGRL